MMLKNVSVLKHILRNSQVRSGKVGNHEQENKIKYLNLFYSPKIKGP